MAYTFTSWCTKPFVDLICDLIFDLIYTQVAYSLIQGAVLLMATTRLITQTAFQPRLSIISGEGRGVF